MEQKPEKPKRKRSAVKRIGSIILLTAAVLAGIEFMRTSYLPQKIHQEFSANRMYYHKADLKMDYDTKSICYSEFRSIPEQKSSCILIDFDKPAIGFFVYGDLLEYNEYRLTETTADDPALADISSKYIVQAVLPAGNVGRAVTFCEETVSSRHRTNAVIFEKADGTILYSAATLEKGSNYPLYTGLNWSEYYIPDAAKYQDIADQS